MAVLSGIFDDVGDSLTIQYDPIQTLSSVNFFLDSTQDTDGGKFFVKEYRYSTDTINFTAWKPLTDVNLQAIVTDTLLNYYFEIRYTRAGATTTGTITWDFIFLDTTLDPTVKTGVCDVWFSVDNLFCNIDVNDVDLIALCGNMTEKMEKYGVMPQFIERSDDYKHFWEVVSCFLSLHYVFALQFSKVYDTQTLLVTYMRQRGLFLCGDESLAVLQGLIDNYFDEFRKRGTDKVDLEIKRLYCLLACDEFIFEIISDKISGWHFDKSSIIYKGIAHERSMNKLPDAEKVDDDIESLSNYHLVNPSGISLVAETKDDGSGVQAMHIDNVTSLTGIRQSGSSSTLKMLISPNLNYEVTFFVKQEVLGNILSFGLTGFDCNGVLVDFESVVDASVDNYFFQKAGVIKQTAEWVQVRGIIYNKDQANLSTADATLRFGFGNNLRSKSTVAFVYPRIEIDDGVSVPSNSTKFYGIRVALTSNKYSMSFMELNNWIITYGENKNPELTDAQVKKKVDKYLIPANTTMKSLQL